MQHPCELSNSELVKSRNVGHRGWRQPPLIVSFSRQMNQRFFVPGGNFMAEIAHDSEHHVAGCGYAFGKIDAIGK